MGAWRPLIGAVTQRQPSPETAPRGAARSFRRIKMAAYTSSVELLLLLRQHNPPRVSNVAPCAAFPRQRRWINCSGARCSALKWQFSWVEVLWKGCERLLQC
jgi:hypothetical protein